MCEARCTFSFAVHVGAVREALSLLRSTDQGTGTLREGTWPPRSPAARGWQGEDVSPSLPVTETLAESRCAEIQSDESWYRQGRGLKACGSHVS